MKTLLPTLILSLWMQLGFGQTTWYQVPTGLNNQLNCIDFPSNNVGFIGGNDTLLLKSVDAGMTWTPVNMTGLNVFPGGTNVLDLKFFTETTGFMLIGPYGGAYKTTDGGLNWTSISVSGNLCYQESFYFLAEDNGFIGGAGCFEGELIDLYDGTTVNQAAMNSNGLASGEAIVDFDFRNANFGLAASSGGRIFRTTDGGQNWDSIAINVGQNATLNSVEITNDTVAYAGISYPGGSSGVLKTIDQGLNWFIDTYTPFPVLSMNFHDTHLATNSKLYAPCTLISTTGFRIFENSTPAAVWSSWDQNTVDQPIYNMTSYSDSIVWGVGDSGYVVVNVPPATLDLDNSYNQLSFDVYPNPVSTYLTVQISENIISGSIYNLSGQKVQNLDASKQIDVRELEKSIYILQITTENGMVSRKFIKN